MDRYTIFARLFPAMLASLPVFVLAHYLVMPIAGELVREIVGFKWLGDLTITAAVIFLLTQINRWISKSLFEDRLFGGGTRIPTTKLLLHSDSYYSREHKARIHEKVLRDFNIRLSTPEEENIDEDEALKKINEAIGLIRFRVARGRLLEQHNLEYGFVRNLAGGSVVGLIVSGFSVPLFLWFHPNELALQASFLLVILFVFYLSHAKTIITRLGYSYAKVLIQEYMAS